MRHGFVFDEIAKKRVAFLAHRCLEGDRMPGDVQDLTYLVIGDVHGAGNLELSRLSLEDLLQPVPRFLHPIYGLADMNREPNRSALIGNSAGDCLPNPPGGIGGEFEPALVVKLVGRLHETDIAFLDEIEEGETATDVLLCNRDDESKICANEMSSGELAVKLVGVERRSLLGSQIWVE